MIATLGKNKRELYACVKCDGWIAHGDLFCKNCGRQFTAEDTDIMSAAVTKASSRSAPIHSSGDEFLRCPGCDTSVTSKDNYCKKCGWYFDDEVRESMIGSDGDTDTSNSGLLKGVIIIFLIGVLLALIGLYK